MMKHKNFQNMARLLGLSVLLAVGSGCGDSGNEVGAAAPATAIVAVALNADQQEIYETNCAVCHSLADSGAPQTGVAADWQERSARGMDMMIDNAMDGYQAMPPMGGCFHCTEDDFRQLIAYMAGAAAN